jgi:hypothetical protein
MRVELRQTIQPPWTEMEPIRLGSVRRSLGTADRFLTVEDEQGARLRIDLHGSGDECYAFEELQIWSGLIVLGWGEHLYLVEPENGKTAVIEMGSYFGHLYPGDGYLLVATAERLVRVQPDGTILWTSDHLGIDGVIIDRVSDGIVHGSGEWDPPGGWRPFRLSLDTGQSV